MYRTYLIEQAKGNNVPVPRSTRYRWKQKNQISQEPVEASLFDQDVSAVLHVCG
jgi:hypothetical protein